MMLAAPELVVAERIELLDEIEVAAELQHRMLADRMMRGEEGSEFEACHKFLSGRLLSLFDWCQTTGWGRPRQSWKTASPDRPRSRPRQSASIAAASRLSRSVAP